MQRWLIQGAVICALSVSVSGCYYAPVAYPAPVPASYDRSFSAASNAMRDQGLTIRTEDRAAGTIVGTQGGATITANVRHQADGSVRVQFDANGPRDPSLIDRVSRSYDGYMGR
ncbi:MAG: hypothetical protein J7549_06920 [Variovorax sp.]|nr:hypothetical protein [Variovorax sp.]